MSYQQAPADGLILRPVRGERDAARFIALNETVTGEGVICDRLLHHHPETSYGDYFLVEDRRTGEAVSTTCLLPWRCSYEDIVLNVAMLEMVVTHPDYRHRGLVRGQVERFHQRVAKRGFDLCIIQGIPYYYRQYGYAYALDHMLCDSLAANRVPDAPPGETDRYLLRPAVPDDADTLAKLYRGATSGYQIHVQRPSEYWRYLLQWAQHPTQVVEDGQTGAAAGYICLHSQADGQRARIVESAVPNHEVSLAILRHLKTETLREIVMGGSPAHALVRLARGLGSNPLPSGQWLLRIPDVPGLLTRIGPSLERRLEHSDCSGLTADLCLNLFRRTIRLRFEAGRLRHVEDVGFVDASMGADGGDLCIPPDAFVRLVFGYRGLDDLRDAWPDVIVRTASRHVLEVLFPRMESWVWMPY